MSNMHDHINTLGAAQPRCAQQPTVTVHVYPPFDDVEIVNGIAAAAERIAKEMGKTAADARFVYDGVILLSRVDAERIACVLEIDVAYHTKKWGSS